MSFDETKVLTRTDDEAKNLKEERRRKMFAGMQTGIQPNNLINPLSNIPTDEKVFTGNTSVKRQVETNVTQDNISTFSHFEDDVLYRVDFELIDEYPENSDIFSMNYIDEFARDIDEDGFHGVIVCRHIKETNRLQIISGHRSFRALRINNVTIIPCLIINSLNETDTLKYVLRANINNRKWTPLDYARAIKAYTEKVQPHKEYTGKSRDDVANFFHISPSMVHRYTAILKMIPDLQSMANNPDFPFTAFASASTLTEDDQQVLYDKINEFIQGNPSAPITRPVIESIIKRIKNGTINQEIVPRAIYLDDYVYKARKQLEKIKNDEIQIKDKEQTLSYISEMETVIAELKNKIK